MHFSNSLSRGFAADGAMLSDSKEGQGLGHGRGGPGYRSCLTTVRGRGNGTVGACGNVIRVEGRKGPWHGASGVASRVTWAGRKQSGMGGLGRESCRPNSGLRVQGIQCGVSGVQSSVHTGATPGAVHCPRKDSGLRGRACRCERGSRRLFLAGRRSVDAGRLLLLQEGLSSWGVWTKLTAPVSV